MWMVNKFIVIITIVRKLVNRLKKMFVFLKKRDIINLRLRRFCDESEIIEKIRSFIS